MKKALTFMTSLALVIVSATAVAKWDPDEVKEYDAKSQEAIAVFKEKDPSIQRFFDASPGYVVIPTVGKGGIGIGGARGSGPPSKRAQGRSETHGCCQRDLGSFKTPQFY